MFLLDTNVVSELRKAGGGKADPEVVEWASIRSGVDLFLSAITLLELERGVLGMERRDPFQGARFRRWFEHQLLPTFAGRILPVDEPVARCAASLHLPDRGPDGDALIAATALVHGMTVVTRNVADFRPMGVALLNPWTSRPDT